MGNTNTHTNTASSSSHKRERAYSMDAHTHGRESSHSPRVDDGKTFEFIAGGKKKPVLCYQSSTEGYPNEDDFKVNYLDMKRRFYVWPFDVIILMTILGSTKSNYYKSRCFNQ